MHASHDCADSIKGLQCLVQGYLSAGQGADHCWAPLPAINGARYEGSDDGEKCTSVVVHQSPGSRCVWVAGLRQDLQPLGGWLASGYRLIEPLDDSALADHHRDVGLINEDSPLTLRRLSEPRRQVRVIAVTAQVIDHRVDNSL
jgi:hypothetical protein